MSSQIENPIDTVAVAKVFPVYGKQLRVTMFDDTQWDVPIWLIANHRAEHHKHEFDNDLIQSLMEDTLPVFADKFEVTDWASNNLNWKDVQPYAVQVQRNGAPDYEDSWCNGHKEIV